jgi:hypothetical protein
MINVKVCGQQQKRQHDCNNTSIFFSKKKKVRLKLKKDQLE